MTTADISTAPGPDGNPIPLVHFDNQCGPGKLAVSFARDQAVFTCPAHVFDFDANAVMLSVEDRAALGRMLLDSAEVARQAGCDPQ